jgi:hypothetical protein
LAGDDTGYRQKLLDDMHSIISQDERIRAKVEGELEMFLDGKWRRKTDDNLAFN